MLSSNAVDCPMGQYTSPSECPIKILEFIKFVTITAGNPSLQLNGLAFYVCSHMIGTPKMGCFCPSITPLISRGLHPPHPSRLVWRSQTLYPTATPDYLQILSQMHVLCYFGFIWQYDYSTHPYKWVGPPRNTHGQLMVKLQSWTTLDAQPHKKWPNY